MAVREGDAEANALIFERSLPGWWIWHGPFPDVHVRRRLDAFDAS